MQHYYQNDLVPQLKWSYLHCPVCNQEINGKANCSNLKIVGENVTDGEIDFEQLDKKFRLHQAMGFSALTKDCGNQSRSKIKIEFNYPVSQELLLKISDVPGIQFIGPVNAYEVMIQVGSLFGPNETMDLIKKVYIDFIKTNLAILKALEK